MADLVIKEQELLQLQNMINELPTKFGVPLLNYFNNVANTRAQEAKQLQESLSKQADPKQEDEQSTTGELN